MANGKQLVWIAAVLASLAAPRAARCDDEEARGLLMGYVGQVVNGGATPTASAQFGNLVGVACGDAGAAFTFFTEATTTRTTANGPLRVVERTGTTTIYLASAPGDFASPDAFRAGTPVVRATLRQQVVVDTTTGAFTVVNVNTLSADAAPAWARGCRGASRAGQAFRTVLTGHLNAPGSTPTGWFGGYAVAAE